MNETGIIIKAGNVTIVGVKIESAAAAALVTDSSSSSSSVNVTAAAANLKTRSAAFNGSLGFFTLGVEVQVLGEFALQRAMDWQYNTTVKAWTTSVAMAGKFTLTRDETVQGQTVSSQSMDSRVNGSLSLYSSVYPGPGFNGVYDWAGQLELNPDPFIVWAG
ncbi:hypothetical protein OEZ85_000589 [Tetradesmus obliquus]|uniref:Uncharacterized protein n=1 Tax=Tetradesmus obliquus TaxID=3088 RepID=A0ABY8UJ34_TETOB|nr:hypothetical protein OEZ85_000589 [Tetradesmus obliquus]